MRERGFEIAKGWEDKGINLPKRSTKNSAAYDIEAAEDTLVPSFKIDMKPTLVPTGLKAYCKEDEWYMLANRSSGPKKGLILANGIGIIDADYYENETNDGHFYFQFFNFSSEDKLIKKGDVIGQVIFQKFLTIDSDVIPLKERKGGFGSTDN